MTSIPTKLARALLWLIVGGAVFSAITITGLRVTLPYIDRYQPQLTAWAEQQIGLPISVGTVNGRWFNAGPEFTLSNVALYREDSTQQIVSIGQVSVALNFGKVYFKPNLYLKILKSINSRLILLNCLNNKRRKKAN